MKRVKNSSRSTLPYKAQDEAWGCVREKTHKGNSPLRRELTLTDGNLTEPNLASPKLFQLARSPQLWIQWWWNACSSSWKQPQGLAPEWHDGTVRVPVTTGLATVLGALASSWAQAAFPWGQTSSNQFKLVWLVQISCEWLKTRQKWFQGSNKLAPFKSWQNRCKQVMTGLNWVSLALTWFRLAREDLINCLLLGEASQFSWLWLRSWTPYGQIQT